jgi:hypothetical protein
LPLNAGQVEQASPIGPSLVFFASKLAAMGLVIAAILGVSMAAGIAFQVTKGGTHIDVAAYILVLFVLTGSSALMVGVFSIFVQTIVNNKYVGLLLTVGLLIAVRAGESFAPGYALLWFAGQPDVPLSEMNGAGHFLYDALWSIAYWGCITVLLGIGTYLLWVRGVAAPFAVRFRILRHSMAPTIVSPMRTGRAK